MALFHLHVTQVKRSAGQSVVTSTAYRSGEKLYSEYYGEASDYTHKEGVVCTDILLPPQAPTEYQDRATLWNAVEKAERSKKAQLAYSFDIALQDEFSMEENIAFARQFVSEQLVGRGMIAGFAIHQPDKEDGGIPNPHFHVLCSIRPIEPDGKWGCKQCRRYRLDEDGNRIMGEDGKPLFDAVPTTDWGSPETLEHWREVWAAMVNAKFEEKGLTCRVDHRSYERQGLDLPPTIHEGVAVRHSPRIYSKSLQSTQAALNQVRERKTYTNSMTWSMAQVFLLPEQQQFFGCRLQTPGESGCPPVIGTPAYSTQSKKATPPMPGEYSGCRFSLPPVPAPAVTARRAIRNSDTLEWIRLAQNRIKRHYPVPTAPTRKRNRCHMAEEDIPNGGGLDEVNGPVSCAWFFSHMSPPLFSLFIIQDEYPRNSATPGLLKRTSAQRLFSVIFSERMLQNPRRKRHFK